MSHTLLYDADAGYVVLRVKGKVTLDLIRELAPRVAGMCEKNNCYLFLNDMSKADIHLSVLEVYASPKTMDESGVSRQVKRALVVPATFTEAEFLETVTCNRGHDLKVFHDPDEAKRWLLG